MTGQGIGATLQDPTWFHKPGGDRAVRETLTYVILLLVKGLSQVFYRHDVRWVGDPPPDPWSGLRLVVILNHTSLMEPIFAGAVPRRFLRDVARRGVVPVARKTVERSLVGLFYRHVARNVVPVTRERDGSWERLLDRIHTERSMVVILPEGRMKRRTGLDSRGEPMTVRGGIADIIRAIPGGRMLLAYSGGLHHVHAPGDPFPRLFRTVRLCLQLEEVEAYREERLAEAGQSGFKAAVKADLTRRRDALSPTRPETDAGAGPASPHGRPRPGAGGDGRTP